MRYIAKLLLLSSLLISAGCADRMAARLMDSVADNAIKMMKAQAEIDKEKRKEVYEITGVVSKAEMDSKVVPDNNPDKLIKTTDGNKVKVEPGHKVVKIYKITFEDGREKQFDNIPNAPVYTGKNYIIRYNGMNEIISVQEIKE